MRSGKGAGAIKEEMGGNVKEIQVRKENSCPYCPRFNLL